jgi:DMSO/TMAO reductase YedYZ molybdopterin-dependent catalytic subunit
VIDQPPAAARLTGPFAGAVAAAAALGAGELLAGLLPGAPSPILSVGRVVVDLQPPGAKELFVDLFGTADKLALELIVIGAVLAIGAGLGRLAQARFGLAAAAFVGFAGVGFVAALRDPNAVPAVAAVAAAAIAGSGIVSLSWLLGRARRATATSTLAGSPMPDWSRRGLLIRGGTLAVGSVVAGAFGRSLLEGSRQTPGGASLPSATTAPGLPAGAELAVAGITPLVIPNPDFYRIDTALIPPSVDREAWRLRIHGMVEREVELDYEELVGLGPFEQYVTIACVSNRVGGDLIGNAKWTGVRLRDALALVGVQPGASQLVGRSIDGWTAGMPTAWILDPARESMIAVGMNGAPLPREHGYPARLIVPGLYGYVSATKWLTELELTTLDAFDAYWVPLGWAKEAPVLTHSRIDVPRHLAHLPAGQVTIAGVAWAMDRGVRRVEVAIDGAADGSGDWREATLSTPISAATWVQWTFPWTATAGEHSIAVRTTDGNGDVQTAERTRPDPDGARGHHTIRVTVE